MSTRSWQETSDAAHAFVRAWDGERRERAEKDTFWNELLAVFGISRRQVARFEPVAQRYSTGRHGFIDVFWPGRLLVEHKGRGANLAAAMEQALDYLPGMAEEDVPQVVVVCDFETFVVRNLDSGEVTEFTLAQLPDRLGVFSFLTDSTRPATYEDEEDVNLAATALLAVLHDALREVGYDDHQRRVLLTRLLFCLFADDAQVWPAGLFQDFLMLRTDEDGANLGAQLAWLFEILDTSPARRPGSLPVDLREFAYINGGLFAERLPMAWCDQTIRQALLKACRFNWSQISPAIFGSMFQNVMTPAERRALGAHYTTEANILRTIRPLFLDGLEDDLSKAGSKQALRSFIDRLAGLRFLDPACGCGNFLIIAYRELRRLELQALVKLRAAQVEEATAVSMRRGRIAGAGQLGLDAAWESKVHVGQFFGIEIEEFPCRIAETAMHLMDHLANLKLSAEFGQYYARFPITESATIVHANALRIDWADILPAEACSYVLGNPPFVGALRLDPVQTEDRAIVFAAIPEAKDLRTGRLDYVLCWYGKAMQYLGHSRGRAAFVSTNSIVQGEQARSFGPLLTRLGFEIDFAHRTFAWTSEARGSAVVHVVIVGFGLGARSGPKALFDYPLLKADPIVAHARHINVWLADAPSVEIAKRSKPFVSGLPVMTVGSQPTDSGHLTIGPDEIDEVRADPIAARFVRRFLGATEMLYSVDRWCLWLVNASPQDLRTSPVLRQRIEAAKRARSTSPTEAFRRTPGHLFTHRKHPERPYVALPQNSSDSRRLIPAAYYAADEVASNKLIIIPDAPKWLFALLQSAGYMVWVRSVAGRLKSDPTIAADLCYNAFPWPEMDQSARERLTSAADLVLTARSTHSEATLADLYDPFAMPISLVEAHDALDRVVDRLYGLSKRPTDAERAARLFERYEALSASGAMLPAPRQPRVSVH